MLRVSPNGNEFAPVSSIGRMKQRQSLAVQQARPAAVMPGRAGARSSAGRLLRRGCALLAGLGCHVGADASNAATVVCELASGRTILTSRDLAEHYPSAVRRCQPAEGGAAAAAAAAPRLAHKLPRLVWSPLGLMPPADALPEVAALPRTAPLPGAGSIADGLPFRRAAGRIPEALAAHVAAASARYGVDPHLVRAVMRVESAHRADAVSHAGAIGLMQIMPATGARYGVASRSALFDPATNIDVGIRYLRDLLKMFPGRIELALAAYNAGEGAVIKYGRQIPPYSETRLYVRSVLAAYDALVRGDGVLAGGRAKP